MNVLITFEGTMTADLPKDFKWEDEAIPLLAALLPYANKTAEEAITHVTVSN